MRDSDDINKTAANAVVRTAFWSVIIFAVIMAVFVIFLPSCSPKIIEKVIVQHDTTKVVRVDSLWQYQKDSVFVKEKGDTVYQYVEHIRYRDRVKVDTLVRVKVDSVTVESIKKVEVEKPLSKCQSFKLRAFWWLICIVAALLVWIFRKPLLKLIKRIIALV